MMAVFSIHQSKRLVFMFAFWRSTFAFLDNLENSDVRALRTRLEEEKATRLLLQNDVDVMMVKVARLEKALQGLTVQDTGYTGVNITTTKYEASFTARLKERTPLDSLHTIVFNDVIHNIGGGYSPNTGVFKAPFSGTYVFSLTLLTYNKGKNVHAQIIKNGGEIGRVFTGDNVASWGHTGSITVVTSLNKDDEVFVREMKGGTGEIHGDFYCTFSAFLI